MQVWLLKCWRCSGTLVLAICPCPSDPHIPASHIPIQIRAGITYQNFNFDFMIVECILINNWVWTRLWLCVCFDFSLYLSPVASLALSYSLSWRQTMQCDCLPPHKRVILLLPSADCRCCMQHEHLLVNPISSSLSFIHSFIRRPSCITNSGQQFCTAISLFTPFYLRCHQTKRKQSKLSW